MPARLQRDVKNFLPTHENIQIKEFARRVCGRKFCHVMPARLQRDVKNSLPAHGHIQINKFARRVCGQSFCSVASVRNSKGMMSSRNTHGNILLSAFARIALRTRSRKDNGYASRAETHSAGINIRHGSLIARTRRETMEPHGATLAWKRPQRTAERQLPRTNNISNGIAS